jgi:hypothetical protein
VLEEPFKNSDNHQKGMKTTTKYFIGLNSNRLFLGSVTALKNREVLERTNYLLSFSYNLSIRYDKQKELSPVSVEVNTAM